LNAVIGMTALLDTKLDGTRVRGDDPPERRGAARRHRRADFSQIEAEKLRLLDEELARDAGRGR
jgi:hypothetical protein